MDFVLDVIYSIDMIRCFTQPILIDGRLIFNRRTISSHYVKGWFILDVYCYYPLAMINYINWDDNIDAKPDNFFIIFIT
jgi:hypothetical protein